LPRVCRRLIGTCLGGRRSRKHSWPDIRDKLSRRSSFQPHVCDRVLDHKVRQRNSCISVYGRWAVIHAREVSDSKITYLYQFQADIFYCNRQLFWRTT